MVDVEIMSESDGWRRPGRPSPPIPESIRDLVRQTYQSGKVGVVRGTPEEIAEVRQALWRAANKIGKKVRFQHRPDGVAFRVQDKRRREETPHD